MGLKADWTSELITYPLHKTTLSVCGVRETLHAWTHDAYYNTVIIRSHVELLLLVINDNLRLLSFRIESEGWVWIITYIFWTNLTLISWSLLYSATSIYLSILIDEHNYSNSFIKLNKCHCLLFSIVKLSKVILNNMLKLINSFIELLMLVIHDNLRLNCSCLWYTTIFDCYYNTVIILSHVELLLLVINDNLRLLSFRIESEEWVWLIT